MHIVREYYLVKMYSLFLTLCRCVATLREAFFGASLNGTHFFIIGGLFMNKFTSTFNFDDIGQKIKNVAKWSCWVEIVLVWIGAAISFIVFLSDDYLWYLLWIPFVAAIFGPFIIWLSYWMLYAFGELVDNSAIIAKPNKRANEKHEKAVNAREQKRVVEKQKQKIKVAKTAIANSEIDEDEFIDVTCPHCNEELSYTKEQLQSPEGVICPMCDTAFKI